MTENNGFRPYKGRRKKHWDLDRFKTVLWLVLFLTLVTIGISTGTLEDGPAAALEPAPEVTALPKSEVNERVDEILRNISAGDTEPDQAVEQIIVMETAEQDVTYLGQYKITGYDPYCTHCCGKCDGITASGATVTIGKSIAMKGVPFGTQVYIKDLGYFTVEDRGVGAGVVDVACADHAACYAITGNYEVYLVNEEEFLK